jgi:hypothetical protein
MHAFCKHWLHCFYRALADAHLHGAQGRRLAVAIRAWVLLAQHKSWQKHQLQQLQATKACRQRQACLAAWQHKVKISNALVALQLKSKLRMQQGVLRAWQLHAKQHPLAAAKAVLHWQWLVHQQCYHWQHQLLQMLQGWQHEVLALKKARQTAATLGRQKDLQLLQVAVKEWGDAAAEQR